MVLSSAAGSAPAVIWAWISAWICASVMVAPLRDAAGAMVTAPMNEPRPITWAGLAVLYSLSQS